MAVTISTSKIRALLSGGGGASGSSSSSRPGSRVRFSLPSFSTTRLLTTSISPTTLKLTAIAVLLLAIILTTRFVTGEGSRHHRQQLQQQRRRRRRLRAESNREVARLPPAVPYWIPLLGHVPNFVFDRKFLERIRETYYDEGMAALNLFGATHVFVFRHGFGTSLMSKSPAVADAQWVRYRILEKGFGYPVAELPEYVRMGPEWFDLYTRKLLADPSLGRMVARTAERLVRSAGDFVTFGSGSSAWHPSAQVPQTPWERIGKAHVVPGGMGGGDTVVEVANLAEMVRSFVSHVANGSLVGDDFMANFPGFWDRLWEFSETWILLVLGLPKGVGAVWPKLKRATDARDEMLACVREFHAALETKYAGGDPGPRWRRLDTVADIIKGRMELYRRRGVSLKARTSNELGLVWSMNVNSTMLVFWIVYRISSDPSLLARVREEIAPFVVLSSDGSQLESVDIDGLVTRCPLLKAAYVESLRLDNTSWGFKQAKQDLVLSDKSKGDGGMMGDKWLIPKGAFAYSYEELQHSDPRVFPDPLKWSVDRHLVVENGHTVARMGIVRPYGAGPSMCPGRNFALKETMAFPAVILAMYDISPVGGGNVWKLPKPNASSVGVKTLKEPYPVWVKRRKFGGSAH